MLKSFVDEFDLSKERARVTPADPGSVLVQADESHVPDPVKHKYFRSGVGKLLYMARWSRPDIQNAVRELSKQSQRPTLAHEKAMHRVMKFCVDTPERGWFLNSTRRWDGIDREFQFRVRGKADADFAKCPKTRRSVSG